MSIRPGELHRAAVALGSNLGESALILQEAVATIDRTPEVKVLSQSRLYPTAAVGPPQPDYLNRCAILQTTLSPEALLHTLLAIEQQFGRVRRERWGARLLDLDLLLFDDLILEQPDLQIPHPRMGDRAFVLVPLAEIAADWVEPVSRKTIAQLLEAVDCSGVKPPLL